ncbi:hypothetical protein [Streptomyces griseomycini]|uniref:Uncharacterized protein n=1 Tax=Streptomyces griseomycini TaxID=66895 RepID=A0A7W7LW94_9ACTN|nr:hypothetical protein [Streptomyces griseomycini]MBB4897522.1 hypothetical protein [Streptomyces griseomycini]GGP90760.1 hypothetical protein GCM10010266_11740 [Streptomyces griseomycini]GGR13248.1 hypothetical protein GCM10015536_18700 [Streptomyces griseomycini]
MPADRSTRRPEVRPQSQSLSGVPMRDLLAACAAAAAISTPPRAPEPRHSEPAKGRDHRDRHDHHGHPDRREAA